MGGGSSSLPGRTSHRSELSSADPNFTKTPQVRGFLFLSTFSRRVIEAYAGVCAMCGLDVGLVEGAHIYPVSAPGSQDEIWNGLALCANHHLAFDNHRVAVNLETSEILVHREIREQVDTSPAVQAFVSGTFARLADPIDPDAAPRPQMFQRRYGFFVEQYDWMFEL